jgi:hypothetical protein
VKKICKDPATQTTLLLKEMFGRKYLGSSRRVWPRLHKTSMEPDLLLEAFKRFVYVMSVLEHYSDHDCSLLLGCAQRDVVAGRVRALQQTGSAMESPCGCGTSLTFRVETIGSALRGMARIETQVRWSRAAAVARELRVFAFARNGNGATWFPAVVGNPEFMPGQ